LVAAAGTALISTEPFEQACGERMFDRIQCITCRAREVGRRAERDTAKQHDALLVGDHGDGFDDANGWCLVESALQ
jgi:hypothetical protein